MFVSFQFFRLNWKRRAPFATNIYLRLPASDPLYIQVRFSSRLNVNFYASCPHIEYLQVFEVGGQELKAHFIHQKVRTGVRRTDSLCLLVKCLSRSLWECPAERRLWLPFVVVYCLVLTFTRLKGYTCYCDYNDSISSTERPVYLAIKPVAIPSAFILRAFSFNASVRPFASPFAMPIASPSVMPRL